MWRGTVQKFSSGGSGFDPSFSKAEKVRIVGVDQIRQCSRMKRMENGADVESAQSEVCWARIQLMSPERRKKARRSGLRKECALASKEQKDCRLGRNAVGVLLASSELQGRMDLARR